MATILPFVRPAKVANPSGLAPGVPPFDHTNPAHVRAWNTFCALARSEERFLEKARRERRSDLEVVE